MSKSERAKDAVSFFARFFMAYIWMTAGIGKLGERMAMSQAITAYKIFTPQWSDYLAQLIGPLETAGGLLLLLGLFLKPASKVSIGVLALFIVGIAQAWARNLSIDCGCFSTSTVGAEVAMDYAKTIARDVFFIALSAWTIYRPYKKWAIYP